MNSEDTFIMPAREEIEIINDDSSNLDRRLDIYAYAQQGMTLLDD